ncbi:MAG: cation:dicarboxylase symporter family transporter [Kiritimatiellae bacterium]|nr:cation:dicarboxylase symporter family transporter [Kiritimatiellia bacterium]
MNWKQSLLPKLFAAIAVGVVVGLVSPAWGIRALNCFRAIFGQFIKFIVPFIIVGLVTPAIADTGRNAGRMLLFTLGVAYASTLCAGYFAFGVSCAVFPPLLDAGSLTETVTAQEFKEFFSLKIPPVMNVTTALAVAFMTGLGIIHARSEILYRAAVELRDIVTLTIAKAFVPFLPFYILTVMADLTASGKLAAVGGGSVKIMGAALAVTTTVLIAQYLTAGLLTGRNPFKALWTMLPAYLTGWGCCSSAATIPYTLRQTRKNGVSGETADLVIPLCANVHLAGSMANMVVYAAGLLVLAGEPLSVGAFTHYILTISVIAVASPGVPGGVVLASASVAEAALGFSEARYAVMIALYMALDGMGTACNLTGDGAIAMVVDKFKSRVTGAAAPAGAEARR